MSRRASLAAWVAPLALAYACGGQAKDTSQSGAAATKCVINSDCPAPLTCAFGFCHSECESSIDCPQGQRCVRSTPGDSGIVTGTCQLAVEARCSVDSACKAPLLCAADGQCRNSCFADGDCMSGQVCASGICADPSEVNSNGGLIGVGGAPPVGPCKLNSECNGGLICTFGLCHAQCLSSRDCPAGQRCISSVLGGAGSTVNVCQLTPEAACHYQSDCPLPLVCAADLQCRNECMTDRDCLMGQMCASGACADPSEINPNGTIKGAIDGGGAVP